jgi:hypothetical protein
VEPTPATDIDLTTTINTPREFTLCIDPELLLQELQYLEDLQRREHNELLAGVIELLRGIGDQAFIRYGLVATTEPPIAMLTRLAQERLTPEQFQELIAQSLGEIHRQVTHGDLASQIAYMVRNFGEMATRIHLLELISKV